jgi:hypothetical protein
MNDQLRDKSITENEKRKAEYQSTPNRKKVAEEGRTTPRVTRSVSAKKSMRKTHNNIETSSRLVTGLDHDFMQTVNEENTKKVTKKQKLEQGREAGRNWAASEQLKKETDARFRKLSANAVEVAKAASTNEMLRIATQDLEAAHRSIAGLKESEGRHLDQIRALSEMLQQKQLELEQAQHAAEEDKMIEATQKRNNDSEKIAALKKKVTELKYSFDLRERSLLHHLQSLRKAKQDHEKYPHGVEKKSEDVAALKKEISDLKSSFAERESSLLHELQVQDEIRKHLHDRVMQLTGNCHKALSPAFLF